MAKYEKQNFADGQVLYAAQLEKIEDAIIDAQSATIEIDRSLTYSGKAADAATVGIRLKELENSIGQSESTTDISLPNYWLNLFNKRIPCVRKALMNAGWNKSSFLWYHDSHWQGNSRRSPQLLTHLNKKVPINKTNYGGDITLDELKELEKLDYLWDWRTMIRNIPNHHSVPGNHDDCNETESNGQWWSLQDVYAYLLGPEETPWVQQGNGLYYYIDNNAEHTRYIYLDTATSLGTIGNTSTNQQLSWLQSTLKNTPENWHIVAIAHIWKNYRSVTVDGINYYYTDKDWSSDANKWYGQKALQEFGLYNAREDDYVNCKAKVEFCIGGHTHWDADYVYEYNQIKIPVILTTSDALSHRFPLEETDDTMDDYGATVWTGNLDRETANALGTVNEAAVDAIIADYDNNYVSIIRFGRGTSRKVWLDCREPIHELIEDIEVDELPDSNYLNLLATVGYTKNSYVSTSNNGILKNNNHHDTTGLIKVKPGDNIYFANLDFYHPTDEAAVEWDKVGIYCYDEQQNLVSSNFFARGTNEMPESWQPKLGYDGDIAQFTLPTMEKSYSYIRITACEIRDISVITLNEWLELDGTTPPPEIDPEEPDSDNTENDSNDYTRVALIGKFHNLIKTAISDNTSGYVNNQVITDTGDIVSISNWDTTGYISVKKGDIVRLHAVQFTAPTTYAGTNYARIWLMNSNKEIITSSPLLTRGTTGGEWTLQVTTDNTNINDIVQFTIPTGSTYENVAYMRIVAKDIRGDSIITVNQIIDIADDIVEDYSSVAPADSTNVLRTAYSSLKDFTYDLSTDMWNPPANVEYLNNNWGYVQNKRRSSSAANVNIADSLTSSSGEGWDATGVFLARMGTIVKLENIIFNDMLNPNASVRRGAFMWGDNRYLDEVFPGDTDWKDNCTTLGALTGGGYNILEDTNSSYPNPMNIKVNYTPIFDEYGDLVQFTMPRSISSNNYFIALVADRITKDSKITTKTIKDEFPDGYPDRGLLSKAYYYKITGNTNSDSPERGAERGFNAGRGYVNNAICKIVGNPGEAGYLNYDLYMPGWSVTGYLPVTAGTAATLALNNIKVLDTTKTNHAAIYLFDANFNHIHTETLTEAKVGNFIAAVENNDITKLTYPVATYSNVAYIRIAAADINPNSTITLE